MPGKGEGTGQPEGRLIDGPLNVQEGLDINKVSLAEKRYVQPMTEEQPNLESIIKGTNMIKDRLEDQCWVWAKSASGAR